MTAVTGAVPERALRAAEFARIRAFLFDRTGIELRDGKELMVMSRLDRRLQHHGLTSYTEYLDRLEGGDRAEVQVAIDLLTTNETYFFREPAHFEFLAELVSELAPRGYPVRIWSAACSSGEEAYSIAMTLADGMPPERSWEVVGSDISSRMLEVCRRALYPLDAAQRIPVPMLKAHCLRGVNEYDGYLAIGPHLTSRMSFREINLMNPPSDLGRFDLIFLRNVMIYFGLQTKQDVISRVVSRLLPGGHLIVSHSESLNGIRTPLRMVRPSIYHLPDLGSG